MMVDNIHKKYNSAYQIVCSIKTKSIQKIWVGISRVVQSPKSFYTTAMTS